MNNKEFIQRGAIAALQGILSNKNSNESNMEQRAVVHAEVLLHIIQQKEYSLDDNDIQVRNILYSIKEYIMDVDQVHGETERKLLKKIEDLEYIVANLKRVIENNCSNVNKI